jgi:hypothetical protein
MIHNIEQIEKQLDLLITSVGGSEKLENTLDQVGQIKKSLKVIAKLQDAFLQLKEDLERSKYSTDTELVADLNRSYENIVYKLKSK